MKKEDLLSIDELHEVYYSRIKKMEAACEVALVNSLAALSPYGTQTFFDIWGEEWVELSEEERRSKIETDYDEAIEEIREKLEKKLEDAEEQTIYEETSRHVEEAFDTVITMLKDAGYGYDSQLNEQSFDYSESRTSLSRYITFSDNAFPIDDNTVTVNHNDYDCDGISIRISNHDRPLGGSFMGYDNFGEGFRFSSKSDIEINVTEENSLEEGLSTLEQILTAIQAKREQAVRENPESLVDRAVEAAWAEMTPEEREVADHKFAALEAELNAQEEEPEEETYHRRRRR